MIKFQFSYNLLSPQWWVSYVIDFSQREPFHLVVEMICLAIILYLIFTPSYDIGAEKPLTEKEEEELIAEWQPEPIVPAGWAEANKRVYEPLVVASASKAIITTDDGNEYLNMASSNFLGIADHSIIKEEAEKIIRAYGVGSCGPRGFYGTIDVHLQLEKTFANFMGTEDAILYSDGLSCVASVICAFCKSGDLIITDKHVNFGIQQGVKLSRAKLDTFKHFDMEDLEKQLQKWDSKWNSTQKTKHRRFIVVEGICSYTGKIAPLRQIVELAKKYKFRVLLDDSNAIGVLGATGRGSYEYHGLKVTDVDIICSTLDGTMGSVGGLCIGSRQVVDHQRLSGPGYCFSAASPPYTAKAATVALGLIDANPQQIDILRSKTQTFFPLMQTTLSALGLEVTGDSHSPIVHARVGSKLRTLLTKPVQVVLEEITMECRKQNIAVGVSNYMTIETDAPEPSIRLNVTALHADKDLQAAVNVVADSVKKVINSCDLEQIQ